MICLITMQETYVRVVNNAQIGIFSECIIYEILCHNSSLIYYLMGYRPYLNWIYTLFNSESDMS